ncbi:MAG: hypothetical protein JWM90_407 [Thermoleophilia bacterium]|nr:hypothetical protein [Thermoleophilia bacterium]
MSAVLAWSLVTPERAPAADALVGDSRTLFLSERFSPTGPERGPLTGVVPENLVALKGEREGFQFAIANTTPGTLELAARVVPDAGLAGAQATGQISFELLRAAFVNLPTTSTRVDGGAQATPGVYQDALPPFRNDSAGGRLTIPAGQWGGAVLIAAVRTDAPAGMFGGSIELYDPRGNDTVYARQAFSLDVRNRVLMQGGEKGSFKTVMHVEGDAYWLQSPALRNGTKGTFPNGGYPTDPNRMAQLQALMTFLDSRGVALNEQPFGSPSASGVYNCAYTSHPATVAAFSFLDQTKQRYFGIGRSINPGAPQFPTRMFPSETDGCDLATTADDYHGKIDKFNTPGIKQDDVLHPGALPFYRNIAAAWSANGLFNGSTYVKNPFDEPSDVTKNMKAQYTKHVPMANTLLHKALGKKAKVVLADWPRDNTNRKACRVDRRASSGKSCTTLSGDGFSNKNMWDGKGTDDVDVWLAPFSRLFGRPVPPALKPFKLNRSREYANRLAAIKKLKGGREVWAYNFYTANQAQPQLTIDSPVTDARMNYWLLAREGHTGLFISNTILGWGAEPKTNTDGTRRKGNPWEGATYFQHPNYGSAAGWGNFLYPGYNSALGMATDEDRRGENASPVSTLRMEGLRDGQEDANLMQMYRARFGDKGVQSVTKPIFPGTYKQLPKKLGQVMTPVYSNVNLAQRLETQRRAMITQLG